MNIKEHIEAGHYPSHAAGVSAVTTRGGNTAFIYTTKHHPDWPIVGGIDGDSEPRAWMADGRMSTSGPISDDLLPPPPRKVAIEMTVRVRNADPPIVTGWETKPATADIAAGTLIKLTGEIEEPWIK